MTVHKGTYGNDYSPAKDTGVLGKARRGFAAMTPEKRREIAAKGGKAAHELGRAHRFTPEEASAAGKKRHLKK